MSVADRAAETLSPYTRTRALSHPAANALAAAGFLATDDELEYRRLEAEAERPDMQALADRTMRHVDAVNCVVEAAKGLVDTWSSAGEPGDPTARIWMAGNRLAAAVQALREEEG